MMSIIGNIIAFFVGIIIFLAALFGINLANPNDFPEEGTVELMPAPVFSGNIWAATGEENEDFAEAYRNGKIQIASVSYYQDWEFRMACSTKDPELIDDLFVVLDALQITGTTDTMADDFSDIIVFETEDGDSFSVEFNMENLCGGDGQIYTLDDFSSVRSVLEVIIDSDLVLDDGDDNFIIGDDGMLQYIGSDEYDDFEVDVEDDDETESAPKGGFSINQ